MYLSTSINSNVYTTGEVTSIQHQDSFKIENPEVRPKRTLPAEWAPQSIIQITWPHSNTDWCKTLPEITDTYVRLAYEIARHQPLLIVHPDVENLKSYLEKCLPQIAFRNIRFVECKTNDTWTRDYAFLTVVGTAGIELLDFRFNGWGGKFSAELDNAINLHLIEQKLVKGHYQDFNHFELEGGSIESDGNGTLLTTEKCLLNPNRRKKGDAVPMPDKKQMELILQEYLGVERVLWLKNGYLAGDDTDSHIDTLVRFCPNNTMIYVKCTDPTDEHYESLQAMEKELQEFRTLEGRPYRLLPVPMPRACYDEDGGRLPATYANFLIMNHVVLIPTYQQPEIDTEAKHIIQQAFPFHEIVTIDCCSLIRQHGSLHCATMQYPRGVFSL